MDEWLDVSKWKNICPDLSITAMDDVLIEEEEEDGNLSTSIRSEMKRDMKAVHDSISRDGYALLDENVIERMASIDDENGASTNKKKKQDRIRDVRNKVAEGIRRLVVDELLPATFILLFDETWMLTSLASRFLTKSTHPKNMCNFDILAWYIDASRGDAGFSPHRDRQPDDIPKSFHRCSNEGDAGMAKYVTMWMALTDATPENSCLYVIPAEDDPGYYNGDAIDEDSPDPLQCSLQNKSDYQNIRALPRKSGECVAFTHRILHWGSRGNKTCKCPRIALSVVVSSDDFESPYLLQPSLTDISCLRVPHFRTRLLLVCSQMLIYHQRFDLDATFIRTCFEYCKANENLLERKYFQKVRSEFISAMKEHATSSSINESVINIGGSHSEGNFSDDDAVLDAMLCADEEGEDVVDDFEEQFEVKKNEVQTNDEDHFIESDDDSSYVLFQE